MVENKWRCRGEQRWRKERKGERRRRDCGMKGQEEKGGAEENRGGGRRGKEREGGGLVA